MNFAEYWFNNQLLCWGVGPSISAMIGMLCGFILTETWVKNILLFDAKYITYGKKSRNECLEGTHKRVPRKDQFYGSMMSLGGPIAWLNSIISAILCSYLLPSQKSYMPESWLTFVVHLALQFLIGDFFLYWGHRIQHENKWLWDNCHSYHHKLDTPTAFSVAYIETTDATLQAGIPMVVTALIVRPHAVTYYAYVGMRIFESTIVHSGLNSRMLDILSLRFLPLRSDIGLHDSHHKYSNYSSHSKNFAEAFWFWDWLFGTYRSLDAFKKMN